MHGYNKRQIIRDKLPTFDPGTHAKCVINLIIGFVRKTWITSVQLNANRRFINLTSFQLNANRRYRNLR